MKVRLTVFITKKLAEKLKCPQICREVLSVSTFGAESAKKSEFMLVSVNLESHNEDIVVDALVCDSISAPMPMKMPKQWLKEHEFKDLQLADKYENDVLQVEMKL